MKPLDTDLLLAACTLEGPFRKPHAYTVTLRMRFRRWLWAWLTKQT